MRKVTPYSLCRGLVATVVALVVAAAVVFLLPLLAAMGLLLVVMTVLGSESRAECRESLGDLLSSILGVIRDGLTSCAACWKEACDAR